MVTKLWAFNHNDENGKAAAGKVAQDHSSLLDRVVNVVHPMLDGVEITNLDYADLLIEPEDARIKADVFVFLDPPYDDQESLYRAMMGNRTVNATPEQRQEEWRRAHWNFSMAVSRCPHRWLITHSNTKFFRSRSVFNSLSERAGIEFFEHQIISSLTANRQTEVFTANYKPGQPDIRTDIIRKVEAYRAKFVVDGEIDWAAAYREMGLSQVPYQEALGIIEQIKEALATVPEEYKKYCDEVRTLEGNSYANEAARDKAFDKFVREHRHSKDMVGSYYRV
jgi:DNA adenine methylase